MKFKARAVLTVARLLKHADDANPDVGMGWDYGHFVDGAVKLLELNEYDFDRAAVLAAMKEKP